MSGYQFVHMETYARAPSRRGSKASARSIAMEAEREPAACRHVESPQPPVLVHGMRPSEAVDLATARADQARDPMGRRLRRDAQVIAGIVASHAKPCAELEGGAEDPELQDWIARTLEWARSEWGDQLVSAVLHVDEQHPHLHLYAVPNLREDGTMTIRDVHAGVAARDAIPAKKGTSTERKAAYKAAMRSMQDRYQEHVGQYHAQARLGPQRRRMTRETYMAETAERERLAAQLRAAEGTQQALAAEAAAQERRERELRARTEKLRERLERLRERERSQRDREARWSRWGGRLGHLAAALSGVRTRIERRTRDEVGKELEGLSDRLAAAEKEREALREAQRHAVAAAKRYQRAARAGEQWRDRAVELEASAERASELEGELEGARVALEAAHRELQRMDPTAAGRVLADALGTETPEDARKRDSLEALLDRSRHTDKPQGPQGPDRGR